MKDAPILLVATSQAADEWIMDELHPSCPSAVVQHIYPEKSAITIDQVRDLKKGLITSSVRHQIIVLHRMHDARNEVQNALLKLLEEQPAFVKMILVSMSAEALLETIRSRCQIMHLNSYEIPIHAELKALFETHGSSPARLIADAHVRVTTADEAISVLDQLLLYLRERMAQHPPFASVAAECLKTRTLIRSNNLQPQLAVDHVLIQFGHAH